MSNAPHISFRIEGHEAQMPYPSPLACYEDLSSLGFDCELVTGEYAVPLSTNYEAMPYTLLELWSE